MANKGYLSNSGLETVLLIIRNVERNGVYTAGDGIAINSSRVISCTAGGALTGCTTIDGVHDIPTDYGVVVCYINGSMSEDDCTLSLDDPDALVPGLTVHAIVINNEDVPMSIVLSEDLEEYYSVTGEHTLCIPGGEAVEIDIVNADGRIIINAPCSIMPYEVSPSEAIAGDVCFYDNDRKRKVIARVVDDNGNLFWGDKISCPELCPYSSKRFSWIGMVVVPGSHNVYKDGSCGVVSLEMMTNGANPSTGDNYLYWGHYHYTTFNGQCNTLTYYDNAADFDFTLTSTTSSGYTVLQMYSALYTCVTDSKAGYYSSSVSRRIPSPYLQDGGRNPVYYASVDGTASCLSDFNGRDNTAVICTMADLGLSDWRTASTLTNSSSLYYFPAACSCWRYHTDGTELGDWYLPAVGELVYLSARGGDILGVYDSMCEWYTVPFGSQLSYDDWLWWSSTEDSGTHAWGVDPFLGYVYYYYKDDNNYVVAFLRVAPPLS